ncbi:DUF4132 domain-containing protein [Janthinobacterium aquaticum]|uniref:DUF4132 domain-containing protein n=1 Tax=Janthinobacterium sp. FT58W TaxID=2654254 RepID=UPI001264FBD5|nr:DUF4132 domain-containing protein [Janthinobacterium sp. FT58W]KAB8044363.1 DUF4132 domain-containing protein [Janthinobacterium sp. FT58W]
MFKKIVALAQQALGTDALGNDDYAQLKKGLRGLSQIDEALWQRACEFVCEGTQEGVLLELQASAPRGGVLLGKPGRLSSHFHTYDMDKKDGALARESLRHRHQFYAQFDAADIAPVVLIRLGKLLLAADQGASLERTGAQVPQWLDYLVSDALHASFADTRADATVANRRGWDAGLLAALLEHEGEPGAGALQLVFERREIDDYQRERCLPRLLAPGALDDYMLAHAGQVEALPATLSASGKVVLARRLGAAPALAQAFAAPLVRLAVDSGKTVRAVAGPCLSVLPAERRTALLQECLLTGKTEERVQAAELLGRAMAPQHGALLEQALAQESSKTVQTAIRNALSWLGAASDAGASELPEVPLPASPPPSRLGDDALQLLQASYSALLEKFSAEAREESDENQAGKHTYKWKQHRLKSFQAVKPEYLAGAIRVLNGEGQKDDLQRARNSQLRVPVEYQGKLLALPEFGLAQMVRWLVATRHNSAHFWHDSFFQQWLARQSLANFDLRLLDRAMREAGDQSDSVALVCLGNNWWGVKPQHMLAADQVWPLFAERRDLIEQGLGLRAAEKQRNAPELASTLEIVALFPVLPAQWLPRVMEFALGEGKQHRASAQQMLAKLPDIGKRVVEALASSKQEMRIGAARWLADLDYRAGVPALYQALDKETRETAIAAYLTALERLGEDLSPRLSPEVLLAAARKGLKGKAPSGLAWFKPELLPACRWRDGSPVEPEIIRWWVVLACKLKEPGGNGLLLRYLGLLDEASRAALGEIVLRQFIEQDVRGPSLDEATAHAQANAPARYQSYQDSAKRYPQYYSEQGKLTPEQVFDEVRREKLAEYLGSAIGEKGILALAAGTPGHVAVSLLQAYMRDHYPRRAQIEAMLDGLADGADPVVIQLLLGIARRYRTASVQDKARLLVERIAQGKGWSQDQLADRTIPTAGFDEAGRLELSYGARTFHVTLDAAMKPVLHNPEGKEIKALPEPRQDESPDKAKEAKQQLSVCKKELKQVITLQTARLYEAMCAGRVWPQQEWTEYLLQHPIAGRLVQQLVWIAEDDRGTTLLRPGDDGSLLDIDDEEVSLTADSRLRLAHGSLLDAAQIAAWHRHLKDYKVKPLFEQLSHQLPDSALMAGREIADRLGWVGDTYGLRGAFTKQGYLRGQAEDGGVFTEYHKDFASAGLRAVIEFSGSSLPEEQMAAALKTLSFYQLPRNWRDEAMLLTEVPPVLLAETYADYLAVAKTCGGYDPQWESKMPW